MASSSATPLPDNGKGSSKRSDRHNQVMLGELPPDFLRVVPMTREQQLTTDKEAALALQQELEEPYRPKDVTGRISISIIGAQLTKNYGITRMDPYVRLKIDETTYETHTDHNGAKNPRWNKIFHCFLFRKVTGLYLEIFDECSFTLDEKIAWANYTFPEALFRGDTLDEMIPLNGRQGDGKEGFINLVLSYTPIPSGIILYPPPNVFGPLPHPYYISAPNYPTVWCPQHYKRSPEGTVNAFPPQTAHPTLQPQVQEPQISDADVQQVKEMFPNIEEDVIKSVMQSNNGNKDRTINALLVMCEES